MEKNFKKGEISVPISLNESKNRDKNPFPTPKNLNLDKINIF